jgi:hypothetical protein
MWRYVSSGWNWCYCSCYCNWHHTAGNHKAVILCTAWLKICHVLLYLWLVTWKWCIIQAFASLIKLSSRNTSFFHKREGKVWLLSAIIDDHLSKTLSDPNTCNDLFLFWRVFWLLYYSCKLWLNISSSGKVIQVKVILYSSAHNNSISVCYQILCVECIAVGMHNENFKFILVSLTKFKLVVCKKDCIEFLFCFEIGFNLNFKM